MAYCIRCRRPLRIPSTTGMGPVCSRRAAPMLPPEELGLFGYDVDRAVAAALQRVSVHIEVLAVDARAAVRSQFRAARVRLGVWS